MSNQLATIKERLELIRPDFEQLNLTGLSFAKELEFAVQVLSKNSYLAGANPESINNALKNVALTGLSLNPVLKYCYLIPRKEKNVLMCLAEPSYVGLIKILTDTGSVSAISATIVYEKEINSLQIQEGAGGHATHKHYFGKDSPGEPMACYTIALLPNGMKHVSLIRPWQWEDIMKRSESVKSYNAKKAKGEYAATPTWLSDQSEMIRKTAIKNHYKYLPKSERAEMIANVIDLDNQVNGIDFEKEEQKKPDVNVVDLSDIVDKNDSKGVQVFEQMKTMFHTEGLPDDIDVDGVVYNLQSIWENINSEFENGTLLKAKANGWYKFIKQQIDNLKKQ